MTARDFLDSVRAFSAITGAAPIAVSCYAAPWTKAQRRAAGSARSEMVALVRYAAPLPERERRAWARRFGLACRPRREWDRLEPSEWPDA